MFDLTALEWLHDFQLLRPWWLLALLPAIILTILLWRQRPHAGRWETVIAAELLPFLLDGKEVQHRQRHFLWAALFWILATIALAGPSWTKIALPIHKQQNPLVVLLDLSPSMLVEDSKPNRLTRARLKLTDLLNTRREGTTALVTYAHNAHVVTPLTDDNGTIVSLIPALHPNIMPVAGSRPLTALEKGVEIMLQANHQSGDLLLITDGITDADAEAMSSLLESMGSFRLSVLALGSEEGAPIPVEGGGFIKNRRGEIVVARLNPGPLRDLAEHNGGRYIKLSNDDGDLDYLTEDLGDFSNTTSQRLERTFDTWRDSGFWLVLLLMPIVVLSFRRNLITVIIMSPLLFYSDNNYAFDWADLWLTADQQGQKAFTAGNTDTAETQFKNPQWKGSAAYRNNNFAAAQQAYGQDSSSTSNYNLGNSLAKAGQLEQAIDAYNEALASDPDFADASFNKQLVEDLLDQQQNQEQKQQDKDQSSEDSSDKEQSDDGSEQKQDQQRGSDKGNGKSSGENDQQSPADPDSQPDSDKNKDKTAEQEKAEQEKNDQQGQQQNPKQDDSENRQASTGIDNAPDMSDEQRQALEQWLRRVPDDPAGLLRRKFSYQAWLQEQNNQLDTNNQEEERW